MRTLRGATMMTMAQLDSLSARLAPAPLPAVTADAARNQVVGAIKMILRMSGVPMHEEVYATELFVRRVKELEDMIEALRKENEKLARVLAQVGTVLEPHCDPFETKVPSKWKADDCKQWMQETAQSVRWAVTAADNAIDPRHEQPIAPGPEIKEVKHG